MVGNVSATESYKKNYEKEGDKEILDSELNHIFTISGITLSQKENFNKGIVISAETRKKLEAEGVSFTSTDYHLQNKCEQVQQKLLTSVELLGYVYRHLPTYAYREFILAYKKQDYENAINSFFLIKDYLESLNISWDYRSVFAENYLDSHVFSCIDDPNTIYLKFSIIPVLTLEEQYYVIDLINPSQTQQKHLKQLICDYYIIHDLPIDRKKRPNENAKHLLEKMQRNTAREIKIELAELITNLLMNDSDKWKQLAPLWTGSKETLEATAKELSELKSADLQTQLIQAFINYALGLYYHGSYSPIEDSAASMYQALKGFEVIIKNSANWPALQYDFTLSDFPKSDTARHRGNANYEPLRHTILYKPRYNQVLKDQPWERILEILFNLIRFFKDEIITNYDIDQFPQLMGLSLDSLQASFESLKEVIQKTFTKKDRDYVTYKLISEKLKTTEIPRIPVPIFDKPKTLSDSTPSTYSFSHTQIRRLEAILGLNTASIRAISSDTSCLKITLGALTNKKEVVEKLKEWMKSLNINISPTEISSSKNTDFPILKLSNNNVKKYIVDLLIQNPNYTDKDLRNAIISKNIYKVREILFLNPQNPNLINSQRTDTGQTALHLALKLKNSEIAALLIKNEASLTIPDNNGNTAEKLIKEKGWNDLLVLSNKSINTTFKSINTTFLDSNSEEITTRSISKPPKLSVVDSVD